MDAFLSRVMAIRQAEMMESVQKATPAEVTEARRLIGRMGGRPRGSSNKLSAARVLEFVRREGAVAPEQVAKRFGAEVNGAQAMLSRLHRKGLLQRVDYGVYAVRP